MARMEVYKITYPNGKIYVGCDLDRSDHALLAARQRKRPSKLTTPTTDST